MFCQLEFAGFRIHKFGFCMSIVATILTESLTKVKCIDATEIVIPFGTACKPTARSRAIYICSRFLYHQYLLSYKIHPFCSLS